MQWVALGTVAFIAVTWPVWLDWRRFMRIRGHLVADRVQDARAARAPWHVLRGESLCMQGTAALLCGDFPEAERLFAAAVRARPIRQVRRQLPLLQATVHTQQGRHKEAIALLGDDPRPLEQRRLRALIAVEVGDFELADRLLVAREETGLDAAMRLRALGMLRARQGRRAEAVDNLTAAVLSLRMNPVTGAEVDEGYAASALAFAAMEDDDLPEAVEQVARATALMGSHAHHKSGVAMANALAAEIQARAGDVEAARRHLDVAATVTAAMASPPLDAGVRTAEAEVALAEGRSSQAQDLFLAARALRAELGERPEVERLDRRLTEFA